MKLILLSGGSGKRLWPLSNESRSKQFLKLLENPEKQNESMVQRVWRQIESIGLNKDTIITTVKPQVDMLKTQIGSEVPLIIEPERRDTFPAISLAAVYLYSERNVSLDDLIVILPVDPYVDIHFFEDVKKLEECLMSTEEDIVLIGVKPTYPSSKYGYIIPDYKASLSGSPFLKVSHFKEKPTEFEAEKLIQNGALWNCGVFAFKLNHIINLLDRMGYSTQYKEFIKQYSKLPKISFDYEVVEKTNSIQVLPHNGYWKDLGTWNTLTEEMATNIVGKGLISEDSKNTHVINELDIPVTILGLSNIVVASSPDGILVSDKSASPRVKDLLNNYNERPMYEERLWGWYKVLDYNQTDRKQEVLTKRVCIYAGKNSSYQVHFKRSEHWTFVRGEGEIIIEDRVIPVRAGDVWSVPQGTRHAIRANTELELIEVQMGSELIEEDIKRIHLKWEDIVHQEIR